MFILVIYFVLYHPELYLFEADTEETWIIKQLKGDSLADRLFCKFLIAHEFSTLSSIQNIPNVSKLVGKIDNNTFAIEYIYPEENYQLSLENLSSIKKELLSTLKTLQQNYIYHRDIGTLCNVIIPSNGEAHLIDFGKSLKLHPMIGRLIGPILAYKDRLHLLRLIFTFNPDALTLEEVEDLLFYRKWIRFFSENDLFLKKLKEHIDVQRNRNN